MTPEELWKVLWQHRYNHTCEEELQTAIAHALDASSVAYSREHQLTEKDRPDFMVGDIAVEVKIQGSLTAVTRQLHRYAQHPDVKHLLLITTRSQHRTLPKEMNGKGVYVLYLNPL